MVKHPKRFKASLVPLVRKYVQSVHQIARWVLWYNTSAFVETSPACRSMPCNMLSLIGEAEAEDSLYSSRIDHMLKGFQAFLARDGGAFGCAYES
jgi:hypothetical protein